MAIAPEPRSRRRPGRRDRAWSPLRGPDAGGSGVDERPPLESLLAVLRARKWWVIQALVLVPLLVGALSATQEKEYRATANLLFRDAATELLGENLGGIEDPTRRAATNDALIALPVIAERAGTLLAESGEPPLQVSADQIEASTTVSPSGDSDLVDIEVVWDDPRVAAQVANAYGEAYIDFRRRSDQRQVEEAIALARQRLDELSPEARAGDVGANLQERLNRLELASSLLTGNAELVQRASPPDRAFAPKTSRNVIFGIILGGILGLGLALVRERLDRTIKTEEELERIYGAPVLARVPRSRKIGQGVARENAPEAEAFRILRANLRYFDADTRMASVLVTSPVSGDGKSTVARGLAMTMADLGDHVVLVEADLHKRSSVVRESSGGGLADVLGGLSLDEALVHIDAGVEGRRLTVLPSGGLPANPSELLESTAMATLIHELERRFEFVVIDSPALSHVSDIRPIVSLVSGLLIVSALGHTHKRAAADFRKQIDLLEGRPLGVVANLASMPRSGYYYG